MQPLTTPSAFASTIPRAVPAPITHLPGAAPIAVVDPTQEIRNLIEGLQTAAQDARCEVRALRQENEELSAQYETALTHIDKLRANEREFRSQFVEITAVIRERDAAVQEADRVRRAATEAQRQSQNAGRERNELQRERDELARRQEEDARAKKQALEQLKEAQKQTVSLRQARDTASSHALELQEKLSQFEDDCAELGYQRDAAQKTQKQAQDALVEMRRQLGVIAAARDTAAAKAQDFARQLDEARDKYLENAEMQAAAGEADSQQAAALAEAREHLASITLERDAARTQTQELNSELETLRVQVGELTTQLSQPSVPLQTHEEVLRQLAGITGERERLAAREHELTGELGSQMEQLSQIAGQLDYARAELEHAQAALAEARREIELGRRDQDQKRADEAGASMEMEARIEELRAANASLETEVAAANRRISELDDAQQEAKQLAARFEKQRLLTIDLGTRFETAQREIVELSANLAEARLAARFANTRAAKEAAAAMKEQLLPSLLANPEGFEAGVDERAEPLAPDASDKLTEKDARRALSAMRTCFQAFQKNASDGSLLNELYNHVHGFSERARASGYVALHRLAEAFGHFVHDLHEFPEMLNATTLRTVGSTIEFLITLTKERSVAQIKDPGTARVYVVDDDADNCEAIKMAMATSMLRASWASEPSVVLAELGSSHYDLIFLDVNMPAMDGFELCSHIRQLPGYSATPVIFISGMSSLENRVQSSLCGGSEFVGKPFNVHELTVKALTLILKAELMME